MNDVIKIRQATKIGYAEMEVGGWQTLTIPIPRPAEEG